MRFLAVHLLTVAVVFVLAWSPLFLLAALSHGATATLGGAL